MSAWGSEGEGGSGAADAVDCRFASNHVAALALADSAKAAAPTFANSRRVIIR
jgi:hypothetical protein